MRIELGRAIVFVVILWIVGAAIHNGLKYGVHRPLPTIQPIQATEPLPVPAKVPTVSISKIWPDGMTPTKIVHIPDPQEPAQGLMDITLHQGDDLELDFDPFWMFSMKTATTLRGTEIAVNWGQGFETEQEYLQHNTEVSGPNALWTKARAFRIRLAPGQPDSTYNLVIHKAALETPLLPVPPQTFDDLTISQTGIQGLGNRRVLVDLVFRNTSSANTIAVAMYADLPKGIQHNLKSSLICSDGTPYVVNVMDTTGINAVRTNLRQLISIGPGQELKASLEFQPRGVRSKYFSSFTLRAAIIVDGNYHDGEFDGYRQTIGDVMPPNCKIVNAVFEIPVRVQEHD